MTPEETALSTVIEVLDDLNIPYMLTGSIAASYHGRPRATHDTDIVIAPRPPQLDSLVEQLVAVGFYADLDRAPPMKPSAHACGAQDLSPGMCGTHGSKRPGASM